MTHWAMTDFLRSASSEEVPPVIDHSARRRPNSDPDDPPWVDPVVDDDGFDPRSRYVEWFWLGVLGPPTCEISR